MACCFTIGVKNTTEKYNRKNNLGRTQSFKRKYSRVYKSDKCGRFKIFS